MPATPHRAVEASAKAGTPARRRRRRRYLTSGTTTGLRDCQLSQVSRMPCTACLSPFARSSWPVWMSLKATQRLASLLPGSAAAGVGFRRPLLSTSCPQGSAAWVS